MIMRCATGSRLEVLLGVAALAAFTLVLLHSGTPQLAARALGGTGLGDWMRELARLASLMTRL